tara:strand:- start:19 stop:291 length:273 start_codon:yes stop_codon:yes gene_type:complete
LAILSDSIALFKCCRQGFVAPSTAAKKVVYNNSGFSSLLGFNIKALGIDLPNDEINSKAKRAQTSDAFFDTDAFVHGPVYFKFVNPLGRR